MNLHRSALITTRTDTLGKGWLMIACVPLGLLLSFVHTSGTMLVLNVAYVDLGTRLMRSQRRS